MRCQNCGAELPDGAKFCKDCGKVQVVAEEKKRSLLPLAIILGVVALGLIAAIVVVLVSRGKGGSTSTQLPETDPKQTIQTELSTPEQESLPETEAAVETEPVVETEPRKETEPETEPVVETEPRKETEPETEPVVETVPVTDPSAQNRWKGEAVFERSNAFSSCSVRFSVDQAPGSRLTISYEALPESKRSIYIGWVGTTPYVMINGNQYELHNADGRVVGEAGWGNPNSIEIANFGSGSKGSFYVELDDYATEITELEIYGIVFWVEPEALTIELE